MAMKDLVVLTVLAFTFPQLISGLSPGDVKERIKIPPSPMPGFNVLQWLGPWYFQYHKAPCSWSISEEFTDFTKVLESQGNKILNHETMRNHGLCNTVTSIWYINGPGAFTGIDPVGNNWTGKIIMVDTDYISFCITWGCTKWSVFNNKCEDPGLYVKTRQLNPPPEVLRRIEIALQNTWGISVNQLTKIPHGKSCSFGGKKIG